MHFPVPRCVGKTLSDNSEFHNLLLYCIYLHHEPLPLVASVVSDCFVMLGIFDAIIITSRRRRFAPAAVNWNFTFDILYFL